MNERIRGLIEQCTSLSEGSTWTSREEFDKEKFAELIVRECAEWIDAEQDEKGDGISDNFYWSARMRLHFGVEE